MIGQTLNACVIESQISVTTTGTIYKAKDADLAVPRAIKIIHPRLASRDVNRKRFKLALQAWANLDHPNFVNIFAGVENEEHLGFIMDYIEGRTLREIMGEQGKLGISQAVDYFLQISRALSFAHKRKILHRKLCPDNIKICKDETIRILGLGALRSIECARVTPQNMCVGKVKYMAPEQFQGNYSIHTDQYTLGVILYEMLTGVPPYQAQTIPELYKMHLTRQPVDPSQINSEVGVDLQNIICKMLAKKPENRFSNLENLISAIGQATDRIDLSDDISVHSLIHRGRHALKRRNLDHAIYFFNRVLAIYGKETPYYEEAVNERAQAFKLQKEEEDIRRIRDLMSKTLEAFDEDEMELTQDYVLKIMEVMNRYPDSSRIRGLKLDLRREMPEVVAEAAQLLDQRLSDTQESIARVRQHVIDQEYELALETIEQILKNDADNKKALLLQVEVLQKARAADIGRYYCRGVKAVRQKDYRQAVELLEKVLELNSEHPAKKMLQEAQKQLEKEEKLKAQVNEYFEQGLQLYETWEYLQAMERFEQVLQLDQNHQRAQELIAQIQSRINDDDQMEDISFFYIKGMEFYNNEKWQEAITCFNHVLRVMSTHKKAREYKDFAEQALERQNIFEQVFGDAVQLFENDNYQEALERFEYLTQLDPNCEEVLKYKKLCLNFIDNRF